MSRRQHTWLRIGAVALIVGLQLLPRAPRGGSAAVAVATPMTSAPSPAARDRHPHEATPATVAPPSTELAIAEP